MTVDKICDICGEEKHRGYKTLSLSGMGTRQTWNVRHKECARKLVNLIEELEKADNQ